MWKCDYTIIIIIIIRFVLGYFLKYAVNRVIGILFFFQIRFVWFFFMRVRSRIGLSCFNFAKSWCYILLRFFKGDYVVSFRLFPMMWIIFFSRKVQIVGHVWIILNLHLKAFFKLWTKFVVHIIAKVRKMVNFLIKPWLFGKNNSLFFQLVFFCIMVTFLSCRSTLYNYAAFGKFM